MHWGHVLSFGQLATRNPEREKRLAKRRLTRKAWGQPAGADIASSIGSAAHQARADRSAGAGPGRKFGSFAERHGDWGRDAALYVGRRLGRLSLTQLGTLVGGLDYAVVSKAITSSLTNWQPTTRYAKKRLLSKPDCPNDKT